MAKQAFSADGEAGDGGGGIAGAPAWVFPVVAKPRGGSAWIGLVHASRPERLEPLAKQGDYIVQERAAGREHTFDLLVDRDGTAGVLLYRRQSEQGLHRAQAPWVRMIRVRRPLGLHYKAVSDSDADQVVASLGDLVDESCCARTRTVGCS